MNSRNSIGAGVALEANESVRKESRANLQTDFIIPVGGKLILTNRRLIFIPDKFSTVKQDNMETIILHIADLQAVEKKRGDMKNLLSGSFRDRLQIRSRERSFIFQVWDLKGWIILFEEKILNIT